MCRCALVRETVKSQLGIGSCDSGREGRCCRCLQAGELETMLSELIDANAKV